MSKNSALEKHIKMEPRNDDHTTSVNISKIQWEFCKKYKLNLSSFVREKIDDLIKAVKIDEDK